MPLLIQKGQLYIYTAGKHTEIIRIEHFSSYVSSTLLISLRFTGYHCKSGFASLNKVTLEITLTVPLITGVRKNLMNSCVLTSIDQKLVNINILKI